MAQPSVETADAVARGTDRPWAPDWLPFALAIPMAVVVANATIGAIIQPAVAATFGLGPAEVGWIVFGYSAAFAVSTVIYAGIAGRVGVGRSLAFGILLFSLAAVAMSVSQTFPQLLLFRIVQGLGAGAVPTLVVVLVAARSAPLSRIRATGILVAGVGIGHAAGPISVGILLELAAWQAALLVGVIGAPVAYLAYRADPWPGSSSIRPDLRGMLLLALFAAGTVVFLNRLPVSGLTGPVLVAGTVTLAALAGFIRHVTGTSDSLFPAALQRDRRFLGTLVIAACSMAAFLGIVVVMPIAIVASGETSGLALGFAYLPMALALASFALTTSRSQARLGRWGVIRLGLVLQGIAALSLALVGAGAPLWLLALLMGLSGAGMGLNNAPQLSDVAERFESALRPRALGIWHLAFFLAGAASAALATGVIGAGWEFAFLEGNELPGFSSVLVVMGLVALVPVLLRGPFWSDRPSHHSTAVGTPG